MSVAYMCSLNTSNEVSRGNVGHVSLFFSCTQSLPGQIGFLGDYKIPYYPSSGRGQNPASPRPTTPSPQRRPAAPAPRTSPTPPPTTASPSGRSSPALHNSKQLSAGRLRSHVGRQRGHDARTTRPSPFSSTRYRGGTHRYNKS